MMKKFLLISITLYLLFFLKINCFAQYDRNYVKFNFHIIENNPIGIIKLKLNDERVKLKYFASKDYYGQNLGERFQNWARTRQLILASSGTYYYYPDNSNRERSVALPVGFCSENGKILNKNFEKKLDGLAMVFTNGKIIVQNIKNKIEIVLVNGLKLKLNLNDPIDRNIFFNWIEEVKATVFQTHLFIFNDEVLIGKTANLNKDYRRFLASGINQNNEEFHFILNLPFNVDIKKGSEISKKYLKEIENLKTINFLINLDTGAQNFLETMNPIDGKVLTNPNYSGKKKLHEAVNLLVYFFQ